MHDVMKGQLFNSTKAYMYKNMRGSDIEGLHDDQRDKEGLHEDQK